ncbi:GNAT family N-acetyltransferase [Devosia sp.]|uniref:GNAT family N-acetyltransferase n=1 Tax=Devosia sp. TaxID=1871048 RepID=UPI002FC97E77
MNDVFALDSFTVSRQSVEEADLAALHALSVSVGWPHRAEDWQFLRSYGDGFVAVDASGRVQASAMWFPFGDDFATVGMVITSPRLQANGGGAWLMQHVLEQTRGRALGLHATRAAHRLYRSQGFADEATIYQNQGVLAAPPAARAVTDGTVRPLLRSDLPDLLALDRRTTGTDRAALLALLFGQAEAEAYVLHREDGLAAYALARPFGRGTVIGPVIAKDDDDAISVVMPHLQSRVGTFVRLDTGQTDGPFAQLLVLSGLTVFDTVTRMSLGRAWPLSSQPPHRIYAIAAQTIG